MTITNVKSRKKHILYPPTQALVEDDFQTWVEEEEEENYSYLSSSYPVCTLETTISSRKIGKVKLIDKFLQNQYPVAMNIVGLKEESSRGKPSYSQDSSWECLLIVCSKKNNVKNIDIIPSKTLKINPFILTNQ